MARKRKKELSMRKVREILRLSLECHMGRREVAHIFGAPEISRYLETTVSGTLSVVAGIAAASGLIPKAAGLGPLAPATVIAAGVFQIFSLFVGFGPTPEEQIMEGIVHLSKQLENVRKEMHARFDRLEDLLNKGLSKVLKASIAELESLARIEGDIEALKSGLETSLERLMISLDFINQNINEKINELHHLDVKHLKKNSFDNLRELLARRDSLSNPETFVLSDVQEWGMLQNSNDLRFWALIATDDAFHEQLPDLQIGLAAGSRDEAMSIDILRSPLANANVLETILTTNPRSHITNLLIEFMRMISVLPPDGIPTLPNPQLYVEAVMNYCQWTRLAKPIWQPADIDGNKNDIRAMIWQAVNISRRIL